VHGVQKGEESGPLEIEATPCVAVDNVVGIVLLKIGTLTGKVVVLLGAADTGVAGRELLGLFLLLLKGDTKETFNVGKFVEPLASPAGTECLDFTGLGPRSEGGARDLVLALNMMGGQELGCRM
jgi:hypothetical protein